MKKMFIFSFLNLLVLFQIACSQNDSQHKNHNKTEAKKEVKVDISEAEKEVKSQIDGLLTAYYEIKNALVATNGKNAKVKAGEFVQLLAKTETTKMSEEQKKFFANYSEKIKFDAEHIYETEDAEHQRDHFNDLSNNLWEVAKGFKINDKPAYQQYCPMKKSYWISSEKSIKNPYYGNKMLNCGKVNATLE